MAERWHISFVPGSHFDLGWCGSIGETLQYSDDIIMRAMEDIVGEYPDYRFTVEYAIFAKHLVERHPELLPRLRDLVREGKVEVCPAYTGMMDQIYDGETTLRNLIYGKLWCREVLDYDAPTARQSDCPGHCRQLPQLLQICDIPYLVHSRYGPPAAVYKWAAPDGSSVIATNDMQGHYVGIYKDMGILSGIGYGWGLQFRMDYAEPAERLPKQLAAIAEHCPGRWVLMGDETDLWFGDPAVVANIRRWNEEHGAELAEITLAVTSDYFRQMPDEVVETLPTYSGEAPYEFYSLPAVIPDTCLTARRAENLLAAAEKFSAWRQMLGLGRYDEEELDGAWEKLFYSQDHNVGGRHGELNDMVRKRYNQYAEAVGVNELDEAALAVTTHIQYDSPHVPITLINALSWERAEPVETYLEFAGDEVCGLHLYSAAGKELDCQVQRVEYSPINAMTRVHCAFVSPSVPGLGYTTVFAEPESSATPKQPNAHPVGDGLQAGPHAFALRDGWPISWTYAKEFAVLAGDTALGHVYLHQDIEQNVREGLTDVVVDCEWEQGCASEQGPVHTRLRRCGRLLSARIQQELTVYRGLDYVGLRTVIDWEEERDWQVRMRLPFAVESGKITYESPYCPVTMPEDEMPGSYRGTGGHYIQKWVDLSNENYGVTVGSNASCYSLADGEVIPVLLRDAASCGAPHYRYDLRGRHEFVMRLLPHRGSWQQALSHRVGWELNGPLNVCRMNIIRPVAPIAGKQFLPTEGSFCSIDQPGIAITAIKKAYDGEGWICRIVDLVGEGGEANVGFSLPIKAAWETNALEDNQAALPVDGDSFTLQLRRHGIHTVRITTEG